MANEEHAKILIMGTEQWNRWRTENPHIRPDLKNVSFRASSPNMLGFDLSGANLRDSDLQGADFYRAWLVETDFSGSQLEDAIFGEATLGNAKFLDCNLRDAIFMKSHLYEADFTGANLAGAKFYGAFLEKAILNGQHLQGVWLESANLKDAMLDDADLRGANLRRANLQGTQLRNATLCEADLQGAQLVETQVEGADFNGALIYGISVWRMEGTPQKQEKLRISPDHEASITVDDLDVAQFVDLLLRREKLRNVIDTITTRAVLILGRFTPERKLILDTAADELRAHNLLPIIFDFEGSPERDLTETIKILAGMSLFVIADVSTPRSSPLELQAIVPDYQIPFILLIQEKEAPFPMLDDLKKYDWVLQPVLAYRSAEHLRQRFKTAILNRAWAKHYELKKIKAQQMKTQSLDDFSEID